MLESNQLDEQAQLQAAKEKQVIKDVMAAEALKALYI